jgi:hypothetical protein
MCDIMCGDISGTQQGKHWVLWKSCSHTLPSPRDHAGNEASHTTPHKKGYRHVQVAFTSQQTAPHGESMTDLLKNKRRRLHLSSHCFSAAGRPQLTRTQSGLSELGLRHMSHRRIN